MTENTSKRKVRGWVTGAPWTTIGVESASTVLDHWVRRNGAGFRCDCVGYDYHGTCAHIEAAAEWVEGLDLSGLTEQQRALVTNTWCADERVAYRRQRRATEGDRWPRLEDLFPPAA